jgi:hypothetical protein
MTNLQGSNRIGIPLTALLQELTGSQLVKKFPTFYRPRRFIIAFTRVRHLSVSRVLFQYNEILCAHIIVCTPLCTRKSDVLFIDTSIMNSWWNESVILKDRHARFYSTLHDLQSVVDDTALDLDLKEGGSRFPVTTAYGTVQNTRVHLIRPNGEGSSLTSLDTRDLSK